MTPRSALAAIAALGIVTITNTAMPAAAAAPDELPPGYAYVVDDTGTIAVAVPDAWTDRDTEPAFEEDGTPVPYIEVAPDRAAFREAFDTPGITFWAETYTDDLEELIERYGLAGGCASMAVEPYDDTVFVGLQQVGTGCNFDGQATWKMIAASPADQAFTVVVHLQTSGPDDEEAIDWARYTFNRVDDLDTTDTPKNETPVGDTVSGVTIGTAENIVGYPGEVLAVTSERGDISVEIPASWTWINYEVVESSNNGMLTATSNADGFLTDGAAGRTADGVRVMYVADGGLATDTTARFLSGGFSIDCTAGDPLPVSLSNGFAGHAVAITDCEGSDVLRNVVVAQGASGAQIAVITQTLAADDPALDLVLATVTSPL